MSRFLRFFSGVDQQCGCGGQGTAEAFTYFVTLSAESNVFMGSRALGSLHFGVIVELGHCSRYIQFAMRPNWQ